MNVLITGGTGLIGRRLTTLLQEAGHHVMHLSRSAHSYEVPTYRWQPERGFVEQAALQQAHALVHLAGANVGEGWWTDQRKKEIISSRVQSAAVLHNALATTPHTVRSFISASGISIYGKNTGDRWVAEDAPAANDFLAYVVQRWEAAADSFKSLGMRVVKLRIGIVLSNEGGALPQLALPVRLGAGAPLGSGDQYMPWIHLDDLCRLFIMALENDQMQGVYNAVGPEPVTNTAMTQAIAKVLHRPLWAPAIPAFALRTVLGEKADIALSGNRVSNQKIADLGFTYQHPDLTEALRNLLA
ncbi:hypothetical protein SAMN05421823_107190 [Catalinimonas alkaloidigena]|uniref:TIGR01777 family protein n=1 Tax=Catalinimonas alkaloidigena TaxID=1075417 RepID=A0A1G9LX91_9BACT|nr:TIGR01777 family oxidoreductase [Catalinimonas alkaloidigena]SDL66327.1 hypothetical protein SAMN05421823_107190 [Catalinimonas alkaloidigena]